MAKPRGGNPLGDWYRSTSEGVENAKGVVERQARQAQRLVARRLAEGQRQAVAGAEAVKAQSLQAKQALERARATVAGSLGHGLAEAQRRISQGVDAANAVAERHARGAQPAIARSRPALAYNALLGNTPDGANDQRGGIDRAAVDRRIAVMQQDVHGALQAGQLSGDPRVAAGALPYAFGRWVGRVRPHGEWDDKRQGGTTDQGNFSYGATAAALGIPEEVALRAAGFVQRATNTSGALFAGDKEPSPSVGHLRPPYGDGPWDQQVIAQGYRYGRSRVAR